MTIKHRNVNSISSAFRGLCLPREPHISDILELADDYLAIISSNFQFILDRFEHGRDTPWINTKFDLIKHSEFDARDPLRGDTVYSWVQGRGLTSLSVFINWLHGFRHNSKMNELAKQMKTVLSRVLEQVIQTRKINNGHMYFSFSPDGKTFKLDSDGRKKDLSAEDMSLYNFSDMFCSMGIYAAGCCLNDPEIILQGKEYILNVTDSLWNNSFQTDQPQLDSRNPVRPCMGRYGHSPFMIQIGAASLLVEQENDRQAVDMGVRLIRQVLDNYVNLQGRAAGFAPYDFFEYIDREGKPYIQDGRVLCDPGHAIEFVGLAMKFCAQCRKHMSLSPAQEQIIGEIEVILPSILEHMFALGFQSQSGGICKLFDLVERKVFNSTMPWWSLPETLRAVMRCLCQQKLQQSKQKWLNMYAFAHNAFINNYLCPQHYLLAYQTCDETGSPVDVISAVPDIDPGYHTGLCLLDVIHLIQQYQQESVT